MQAILSHMASLRLRRDLEIGDVHFVRSLEPRIFIAEAMHRIALPASFLEFSLNVPDIFQTHQINEIQPFGGLFRLIPVLLIST